MKTPATVTPVGKSPVGIVGSGRWGTVLAHIAASQGSPVVLWCDHPDEAVRIEQTRANRDRLPELASLHSGVRATSELVDIARNCPLVILALPIGRLRPTLRLLGDVLDGSHLLVHAVRGMEAPSGLLPSQIVAQETCVLRQGAMLGAALVDELVAGKPNTAVLASRFAEVGEAAQAAFAGGPLRLELQRDLLGIEAAAATASAMAVGLGMADGLGFGPAARASLVAASASEMDSVVKAFAGDGSAARSVAGLGYLLVEREADSRDVQAGRLLARGQTVAEIEKNLGTVDGFAACRALDGICVKKKVAAPLLRGLAEVLSGRVGVHAAVAHYLN
jgi:glycerol-3-phosphate dehydrogenase (NAD(P)+)